METPAQDSRLTKSKLAFHHSEVINSLGAGLSVTLLVKCPAASAQFAGAWLDVAASANQPGTVTVFEAPTTSADGSGRTPRSTNRLDTPPSCPVAVSAAPTVSNDGTALDNGRFALSAPHHSEPVLLKPGTNYLVRLTNTSGVASSGVLALGLGVMPNVDYLRLL
jgi:hypothetical protein